MGKVTDGVGSNRDAFVNEDHRLGVDAEIISAAAAASLKGFCFVLPTNFITYTSLTTHGVLFLKNDKPTPLHIAVIRLMANQVTRFSAVRNPTAGTLVTAGADLDVQNSNFGSGQLLIGSKKVGVDGQTITDGDHLGQTIVQVDGLASIESFDGLILQQGNSIAVLAEVLTNPTDLAVTIVAYYRNKAVNGGS